MWNDICKDRYIMGLIDDRNQIIYRGRMLGLKAMQVEIKYCKYSRKYKQNKPIKVWWNG